MSGTEFESDQDLEDAGYHLVQVERIMSSLSGEHQESLQSLLAEDLDFGSGFRVFVSGDGKNAVVVPEEPEWPNQVSVIKFELDRQLVP